MSNQQQKQPLVVSEWCLKEIKAYCVAILLDGRAITVRQVRFYAFLENQTWGTGYIETALHSLYPEEFPSYSG